VGKIQYALIVCVGVDCREKGIVDAEGLIQHLDQRRQAVARAAPMADDTMFGEVESSAIHAHHQGQIRIVHWIGHQHMTHPPLEEARQFLAGGALAGALQNDPCTQLGEEIGGGPGFSDYGDALAVQQEGRRIPGNREIGLAVHGIVGDEVGQGPDIRRILHGHNLDPVLMHQLPQHQPSNASKPMDGELHDSASPSILA